MVEMQAPFGCSLGAALRRSSTEMKQLRFAARAKVSNRSETLVGNMSSHSGGVCFRDRDEAP
ncbi:protein of unknown function [Hyphomicrobium sp. MC1]|nr:protein of unknown function [Hyphomicrobium sp. MC1]